MLFESLFEESDRLKIDQFNLQSKKVVCDRDVKALFELKLVIDDAFGAQRPWLHTQAHEYRIRVREVYHLVDKDEYFTPREPICVVHS